MVIRSIQFKISNVIISLSDKMVNTYGIAFNLTSSFRWCCADEDIVGDNDDVLFHVVVLASKPEPAFELLCNDVDIADGTWTGVAWWRLVIVDPVVVDPPFWCIWGICSELSKFNRNDDVLLANCDAVVVVVCDGLCTCTLVAIWFGDFGEWAFDAICIAGSRAVVEDDKFAEVPKAMEDECNGFTFVN